MLKIWKKTSILLIILTFLVLTGCVNDFNDTTSGVNNSEQSIAQLFSALPTAFEDVDWLLATMAMVKFGEFSLAEIPDPAGNIFALDEMIELFRPNIVPQGIDTGVITIFKGIRTSFLYDGGELLDGGAMERIAHFHWQQDLPLESVDAIFGRGGAEEFIKQHDGIDYYIVRFARFDNPAKTSGYDVSWVQHGQRFGAAFSADFTLDEKLAFSYAIPIIAWELDGNAVSISVQGLANMSIVEHADTTAFSDEISSFSSTNNEIIVVGNTLYSSGRGRTMEKVGYRWLIDEATQRFQYVLRPGNYEFHAEGVTGRSELLVQHFVAGEPISIVDYSAKITEQSVSGFSLAITPEFGAELELSTDIR